MTLRPLLAAAFAGMVVAVGGCSVERGEDQPADVPLLEDLFIPYDFTFSLPNGWAVPRPGVADALAQRFEDQATAGTDGEIKIDLIAFDRSDDQILMILSQEPTDATTLEEYVAASSASFGPDTPLEGGSAAELAGEEAAEFDVVDEEQGAELRLLLTLYESNGVSIQLIAPQGKIASAIPAYEEIVGTWDWGLADL